MAPGSRPGGAGGRVVGPWALALAWCLAATAGCTEWLEVPGPASDAAVAPDATAESASLPSLGARADAPGPLVPSTPGLRVPGGYWARVRLDVADLLLPHAWAGFLETEDGLVLRIEAVGGPASGDGASPTPTLRAVVPIRLPEPAAPEALGGLTLGPEALAEAVVGLRTTPRSSWLVTPERLVIEAVGPQVVKGTLEGTARRGTRSPSSRPVRVAFVALRAP